MIQQFLYKFYPILDCIYTRVKNNKVLTQLGFKNTRVFIQLGFRNLMADWSPLDWVLRLERNREHSYFLVLVFLLHFPPVLGTCNPVLEAIKIDISAKKLFWIEEFKVWRI